MIHDSLLRFKMIIFTPIFESEIKEKQQVPKYDGIQMSLEEYLNWEIAIEENIKYEWNNGVIEAVDKLRTEELYIYRNLQKEFYKINNHNSHGSFITEVNVFLQKVNKLRRPDIAYFRNEDINKARNKKESILPPFVIEIVSNSNSINEVEEKIKDYFVSGIKIVWIVFPKFKEVKIYNSPKNIKVCSEHDLCDVGTIIPDFKISVVDLFK